MRDAIRFVLVPVGGLEIDVGPRNIPELSQEDSYEKADASVSGEATSTEQSSSRTT